MVAVELNSIMMRNTFKIEGQGSRSQSCIGSCFLIGRPLKSDPKKGCFVLITAAHVLEDIEGEEATVYLRQKQNDSFMKVPLKIKIRQGNIALWVKNKSDLDVAAMYIALPPIFDLQLLPTAIFADDGTLTKYEIHPGDEMCCLGFPLGFEANDAGFPVLRSGRIASFPLIPTQQYRTFLLDLEVFPGNSGGPVYFTESSRTYKGGLHPGRVQFVAGLVSQEIAPKQVIQRLHRTEEERYPLHIAVIIHARYILETVNQLPEPESLRISQNGTLIPRAMPPTS